LNPAISLMVACSTSKEVDRLWAALTEGGQTIQKITPCLLFSGDVCGKAEEAVKYYAEVFANSEIGPISRYREGEAASSKARVNDAMA